MSYDKNMINEHKTKSLLFDLYDLDENIEKKDKNNNIILTRAKYIKHMLVYRFHMFLYMFYSYINKYGYWSIYESYR